MKKVVLTLCAAIGVFLILSGITSIYLLNQARDAISQIETVSVSKQSKDQIDLASQKYSNLSVSVGASTLLNSWVDDYVDYSRLETARNEYTTALIEQARNFSQDESLESTDQLLELITEARAVINAYYVDENYQGIENYADLEQLESTYLTN